MKQLVFVLTLSCLMACATREHSVATLKVMPVNSPADSLTAVPYLATDPSGRVFLSWIERHKDSSRFILSRWLGNSWSEASPIAAGSSWFVNWADYPMLVSDGGGNLMAHVLDKSGEGTYAYDVKVFTSSDSGATWSAPFLLHDDGKQAEHGFVSLVPFGGNVFATWLDGRNASMEGMENMKGMDHSGHHGAMSLRAAVLDYSGKKSQEWELDNKTCDCCQTTAAITTNGPVVIYRDRSDEEIRDMSITRLVNGKWTEPKPVHRDNWKIAGCPVNGPRVAVRGNNLAVAWYTAASEPSHVNIVFSADGGETFGEAQSIDEGNAIGRVDIEWLDEERVVVSWMEGTLIRAAIVHNDGERETPVTIAESSEARSSGFPQMTKVSGGMMFAWTDDKVKRVRTAMLQIN